LEIMKLMKIKEMTIDDYEEAYSLWAGIEGMGLRSLDDSREGIERFLERNSHTCFVCRNRGASPGRGVLAGAILCGHDGRRGYIYHAAVHDDYRRRGIGRDLVNQVISALKKEGIKKVGLVVFSHNERGNAFWESLGFDRRDDLYYRDLSLDVKNI
jgi:ribosomal protein S18 acetylase RimI-like enzyme